MKIQVDEITSVIKEEIAQYQEQLEASEVGRVIAIGDGVTQVYGLTNAMAGEMIEFENGAIGQVMNLEENSVGAVLLGDYLGLKEGDTVRTTGKLLSVPVGDAVIGRVVDPLGRALDAKGSITSDRRWPLEFTAPGIAERQPVNQPLQTGIKAIDSMIPIGRGQRELIIGDRKTGKTAVAVDTIINQRDSGVICVYVAIGQKESTVVGVVETLRAHNAMDYTIVVSASSADPAPLQYIAPYAGCAMAEYFMYTQGRHTLCVYDDLSKQAQAYRQLSLLDCCNNPQFEMVRGDCRDRELVGQLLKKVDVIIPLACLTGAPLCKADPVGAATIVRDAVIDIVKQRSKDQWIVYPVTNSGYGIGEQGKFCTEETPLRPISAYGKLKVEAEKALLDSDNTVTLRLATVFGASPRMRTDLLVNDFTLRAFRDGFIVLFEADFKRNYLHIRDVADAFVHCLDNFQAMKGQPYNVGLSEANISKRELCEAIKQQIPDFYFTEYELGEDPDKRDYIVSNEKLEATGFKASRSLAEGIAELIKAYAILPKFPYGNV